MNGLHLTADLYHCANTAALCDIDLLASRCNSEVAAAGLLAVADRWHRFPATAAGPGGITGVVLLAESHLAIHSWPETGSVTLDIYVCNFSRDNSDRANALLEALLAFLAPSRVVRQQLERGQAQSMRTHMLPSSE